MRRFRVAAVVGTRPDVIKMAPVIERLREAADFEVVTVATAQHRELLDQALVLFGLRPDIDLDLMQSDQAPADFVAQALVALGAALAELGPDIVLVQGDTNTATAAALAAFYAGFAVGHVEAGLRSHDRRQPFPEEVNRRIVTTLADVHFAPTLRAQANLLAEGVPAANVVVTGNTIVDALQSIDLSGPFDDERLQPLTVDGAPPFVVLTTHRRENFGEPLRRVLRAVSELTSQREVTIVYPVHLNPNVRRIVAEELMTNERVRVVPPVSYADLLRLLKHCHLVLTDSGGIQEEAPSFGAPVLVLRDVTERPEIIECGAGRLVGTSEAVIVAEVLRLLDDADHRLSMASAGNPFGDGRAADRIVAFLRGHLADPGGDTLR